MTRVLARLVVVLLGLLAALAVAGPAAAHVGGEEAYTLSLHDALPI